MTTKRTSLFFPIASTTMLATLTACAAGPDYVRPAAPSTTRYTRDLHPAVTPVADGQQQHFSAGTDISADWWRQFGSAPMDAVVRATIDGNPTLQAAEASLLQSQDDLRSGDGAFYPQVSGDAAAIRERPLSTPGTPGSGRIFNLVTASGTITYALDVFGGKRRMVESLQAQADYAAYLGDAAYLALTANVVNTCIARAGFIAEMRTLRELINLQQQDLRATRAQVSAGTAGYAAELAITGQIAANAALLAPLQQKIDQAEHLLGTLEGVLPARADLPDIALTDLALPLDLPLSLPSALVHQRPDILAAEAQLHVASANIGVATAAMFPSISLSGTAGAGGSSLGNLLKGGGTFWSVGPAINVPIFQGGTLWYGRKAAIAAFHVAEAEYRQTVLTAFSQVADVLTALDHDAEALQAQTDGYHAAGDALALVRINFRAGLVAGTAVMESDVAYHQATLSWLQAIAQRHQDTVALYIAVGGGWWNQTRLSSQDRP